MAASLFADWVVTQTFAQAELRVHSRHSSLLAGSQGGALLGAWTSAFSNDSLRWFDPEMPKGHHVAPPDKALERIVRVHTDAFSHKLQTGILLHVGDSGDSGAFVTNQDLLSRRQALDVFCPPLNVTPDDVGTYLVQSHFNPDSLKPLFQFLAAPQRHAHFMVFLDAPPALIRQSGLKPLAHSSAHGRLARCPIPAFEAVVRRLSGDLNPESAGLALSVVPIPRVCEPWWVFDEKTTKLRAAAQDLLSSVDLAGATGPQTALGELRAIWETMRAEVKEKLEQAIEELSRVPLDTFEEKRALAAELQKTMAVWGFRAMSPDGNPAILRCNRAPRNPNGFFVFDEGRPPSGEPSGDRQASVRTRGATSQLPVFKLMDRPPGRSRAEQ